MNKKIFSITIATAFFGIFFLSHAFCARYQKKPIVHKNARAKPKKKRPAHSKKNDKIISLSIPKCGTHLLIKCLALFKIPGIEYEYTKEVKPAPEYLKMIREKNKNLPPNHYKGIFHIPTVGPVPLAQIKRMEKAPQKKSFWNHWPYTPEYEQFLDKHAYANFLIVRDPRDMVVSFAKMVYKSREGQEAVLDDVIIDLITGHQKHYLPWAVEIQETYPVLWEAGLYNFYKLYLPWTKSKNFMLIKFEDLIGPGGGGTAEKQIETITKIAQHIKFDITPKKREEITKNIFGGTWTFREGQIGGWKKYFTPEIKAVFKQDTRLLQLLIDLGYETNKNW